MKLQCSCGAKYAFDATPEMLQNPVKFICPSCGLDASAFVNDLIRQEFGATAPPPPPPAAPASRLRISHEAAPTAAAPVAEAPAASKFCAKHRERATEQCAVCHKPICPKCLEMFGFFCSPLCKGKAEAQHIHVPAFAGRKDLAEAKFWRHTGLITGSIVGLVVLFFVAWTWYAWFGSVPHNYFTVRFEDNDRGYNGSTAITGKDQIVFLHGGTLARYDMKSQKPVWSDDLITKEQVDAAVKAAYDADARANEGSGFKSHRNGDDIERSARQELQGMLELHVSGQDIWVANGATLTQYNWDTGKAGHTVQLPEFGGEMVQVGDDLQMVSDHDITHISLASGESHVEQLGSGGSTAGVAQNDAGAGLPGNGGAIGNKPLDPKKVEAQVQNLNIQGKIAFPAVLANAQHEQQLEQALRDDPEKAIRANGLKATRGDTETRMVPGENGMAEFSVRLLEERMVSRSAMKPRTPGKSVLDSGNLNTANEGDAINEQLNEMQRNSANGTGGDVTEDQSRYQVTVHLTDPAGTADWTAEVVGPPQLFVLKTVNVVASGKDLVVLDKSNKKIWQASLTYSVPEVMTGFLMQKANTYGDGPCVERGNTLYVFDQAVLSAFDLSTGNARWRLPSVGVVGLFFDNKDDVYINTTTGNPDDIKYSRQIDVTRQKEAVFSKVDAKTGKTLWSIKPDGYASYMSGKFIYVINSYDPNPTDEDQLNDMTASMQKPAFLHIQRIRPSDGKIMWDYYDRDRCPVAWHFDNNSIELVFKREVQVLRYVTF